MNWYDLIFSEVKWVRIIRHFLFWTSWWVYFYGSRYFHPRAFSSIYTSDINMSEQLQKATGSQDLSRTLDLWNSTDLIRCLMMLGVHMIATYVIITLLLRFLLETRYIKFIVGVVSLTFAMIAMSRLIDTQVLPLVTGETFSFQIPFYASIFSGLISPIKVVSLAMAIKLGKHWWLKEQEKVRLEKERSEAELQLLKTQIHPQFLFSTLNNIQSFALEASPKAPEMVLKLSDILSFMLYECEMTEVPIEKEIRTIKDFLALERIRHGDNVEMSFNVRGEQKDIHVAPLLLFALVEDSMRQIEGSPKNEAWINIELDIKDNFIEMIIANGKPVQLSSPLDETLNFRSKAEKRLSLQYSGRSVLKFTEDQEMMITTLQISKNYNADKDLIQSNPKISSQIEVSEWQAG